MLLRDTDPYDGASEAREAAEAASLDSATYSLRLSQFACRSRGEELGEHLRSSSAKAEMRAQSSGDRELNAGGSNWTAVTGEEVRIGLRAAESLCIDIPLPSSEVLLEALVVACQLVTCSLSTSSLSSTTEVHEGTN